MNPKLPRITAAELGRALKKAGWYEHRQTGSHLTLKHQSQPGRVVVPRHAGKVIGPGLLTQILRDAGLTVEDLRRLL